MGVEYIDFSSIASKDQVDLSDHVENILHAAVPKLYHFVFYPGLETYPQDISAEGRANFSWFLHRYSKLTSPEAIEDQRKLIEDLGKKRKKKALRAAVTIGSNLLYVFPGDQKTKSAIIDKLQGGFDSLFNVKQEDLGSIARSQKSPFQLLKLFAEITQEFGFKQIIVFVDSVDEYSGQFKTAVKTMKPLVEAVSLHEISPFTFKYFLPFEIQDALELRDDIYIEGENVFSFENEKLWKRENLRKTFEERLICYADLTKSIEERRNFDRLFAFSPREDDVLEEMIKTSGASPRRLIELARMIITEHTRDDPIPFKISKNSYDKALERFKKKYRK